MHKLILEAVLSLVLIVLSALLVNPFNFWMPTMFHLILVSFMLAGFGGLAILIWKKSARDEREELHLMIEGQVAYLAGVATLIVGIIAESFQHRVNIWLLIGVCVMFLAKIFAAIFISSRK